MTTCFEDLCNELLYSIFEYINPRELFEQFANLNLRLNSLLASLNQLRLIVNYENDNEINNLDNLAPHIGYLCVNTWDEIDLNKFCNLRSLSIVRPSSKQLKQIRADTMPKLINLSLFTNVQFISPNQLIYDVFSERLSYLRWARLGHIDAYDPFKWSQSYSLRYLHISCQHTDMMKFILSSCPNLRCFHVDVLRASEKCHHIPPIILNHPLQQFILRDFCRIILQEDLQNFVLSIPNVKKLQLDIACKHSLISFLEHIVKSLLYLCTFDCDITECPIDSNRNLKTIYDIHSIYCQIQCRSQGENYRIFSTK